MKGGYCDTGVLLQMQEESRNKEPSARYPEES